VGNVAGLFGGGILCPILLKIFGHKKGALFRRGQGFIDRFEGSEDLARFGCTAGIGRFSFAADRAES
jgi:hypothetical protein